MKQIRKQLILNPLVVSYFKVATQVNSFNYIIMMPRNILVAYLSKTPDVIFRNWLLR